MLSTFLQSTKALFTRKDIVNNKPSDTSAGKQLQAELANTVEDLMVITRMRGQASGVTQKQLDSIKSNPKKRSIPDGAQNTQQQSSVKHVRHSADRAAKEAPIPTVAKPSGIETASTSLLHTQSADGCKVTGDASSPIRTVDDMQQRGKSAHVEDVAQTRPGKRKRTPRDSGKEVDAVVEPSRHLLASELMTEAAVSAHRRFNSEEPKPLETLQLSNNAKLDQQPGSPSNSDSEDDSPETLTVSAGLNQARVKTLGAKKAAKRQEAVLKRKRQERDQKLRTQAKIAKKHRVASISPPLEEDVGHERFEHNIGDQEGELFDQNKLKRNWSGKEPLPSLLPDDILAAEPVTRLPTPPSERRHVINVSSNKKKFLEADTKPPADINKGPVCVRVLEVNRGTLPPKASKSSEKIRGSWLAGRNASVHRRKIGGGFIRR